MSTTVPTIEVPLWDAVPPGPPMTLEEFRALPDDPAVDRMLINGRLWETPMTRRNRWHARLESRVASLLERWAETTPEPQPEIFSGEIGVDFPDQESSVGIDVAVVSADVVEALDEKEKYIVGVPILAVEILSPSDRMAEIHAKLENYLDAGVKAVWIVDPKLETVVVHQPKNNPQMFRGDDELDANAYLPGFMVPVAKVFRR